MVSTDKKCKDLLRQLDEHLKPLTTEHAFNEDTLKTQIYEGQKLVKELGDCLGKKK